MRRVFLYVVELASAFALTVSFVGCFTTSPQVSTSWSVNTDYLSSPNAPLIMAYSGEAFLSNPAFGFYYPNTRSLDASIGDQVTLTPFTESKCVASAPGIFSVAT